MLDIYSSGRGSQLSLETLCLLCLSSVLVTSEKCDLLDRYGCQTLGKEKRPWVVPCNHMSLILEMFYLSIPERRGGGVLPSIDFSNDAKH